uniref:Uncharacterized protein n=1 Tax=Polytomella parva TaxID=51329 RepID=A0A7S0UNP9_9CHLO|mmetsp:Transcript_16002/g.28745  ORF Transcript_16002/g.28745 Transcript_16002/m.28745 type:complete len:214 (+) Transcript_16002:215-856(+)|eukprot:CAMPEP_0175080548 /NCGR_PEP_ID=MMETSP0052_2-20121109/25578_1 /TAXON_ID=51329 ORGANISM="Polytomella parva, Strain SAG 63-3" /NCGR_SAMPLE_ID=MMETSP0052_2 /ASSEMBLY_ACC=CAM_ASM_000194 /LENGTH=213 /DNA_ID=CAMNT_0016351279 /DNA_START=181 /DNA_END=822 /DNA_ORIENTATION=+
MFKGLFAKPNIKEQVRDSQRGLRKECRDIDREVLTLQKEEQKLIREIKAAAKAGNTASAKILAKSLIRLREQITKLKGSTAHLTSISTQLTTSVATMKVANAMNTAAKTMTNMQKAVNPAGVTATMQQFARENAKMAMTSEMMDDAIDGALDDDEIEGETDELVGQVLDEIGIDLATHLGKVPENKSKVSTAVATEAEDEDNEMFSRLNQLKS